MNWLDVAIILVTVGFVVSAYSAGLIREGVSLVAAMVGIVVGGLLYDDLATDILVFMDDEEAAQAVAFLILVGSVYLFGQIVALMLSKTASVLMLGWTDHAGGAFLGLLKGLIVVQVLLIVFAAYPSLNLNGAVADSSLGPYFIDDVDFLLWVLPENFDARVERFITPQPPPPS
jgi:membrane protein required for colicin V production